MIIHRNIPIKNIYYMLTYAFKELKHNNYEHIEGEDFDNIYDLFAEILFKGVSYLLKQGLHKEYIVKYNVGPTLKGKLNLQGTIKEKVSQRALLACEFDELTINNIFNQIIKSTLTLLIRNQEVQRSRKDNLKRLMLYFDNVDDIKLQMIDWSLLKYDRNSRTYQMLHSLCYFILQNQLLATEKGETRMVQFSDEHMNLLFQRFVLEYYKKHYPKYQASAKQIQWNISDSISTSSGLLPIMQTDITLTLGDRTLIIDTKYYSKNLQENYGKLSIHSPNIYQIYAYVMNADKDHIGNIDGMLLYAQTLSDIQPHGEIITNDGNILMVRTLDLSQDFDSIKRQLDRLIFYKK